MLIAARNGFMVGGKRLPFPRSYMKVSIPSDAYDFRISFAGSSVAIDWGDGTTGTYSSSPATHSYNTGNYTIEIGDTCTRFECPSSYGRTMITEVGFGSYVTSIADAGYYQATSLLKVACAPSVATAVNNTFAGCPDLDWLCDFPLLNMGNTRFKFIDNLSRQYSFAGKFSSQKRGGDSMDGIYGVLSRVAPVDMFDLLPAVENIATITYGSNYYIRRMWLPAVEIISSDSFYPFPNLYGVYAPLCKQVSSCITRLSSSMTNNPLGVTHMRLGHLSTGYSFYGNRPLCWGGSENYLGVFMVNMTRAELATWLSTIPVTDFISQSAFEQKAICTDDSEWNTWNAWFEGGMQIDSVPTFPLNR